MEAPEIVLTEAALQHVEKSQFPKGKHFESIPAGGLRVEDISTQSAASFAHPKGRSTRRIHRSSVLFASALALAAWLTIALIWSGLCQPPGNKAGTVSLVQRRLSHSQHGYKLSKAAHGCAVLEENLEILQSALSTTEEPAFKKSRPAPVVFGSTASSTEELPWFPQGSGRGDYLPKQGDGTAFAGTRTSDLIWPRSSEIERQSLSWTGLQAKEHEAGTATRAEAAGAGWWSSLGEWENEAEVDLGVPSLEPLSTQHQQHVQAQKFPRAPLTEFDVALLQPRSAFEETKTTLSSDAPYLNSQIPVGFQTPTVEEAGGASAVAYPASLYLRPVETAMANQPERADCQTPAANEHTVDYRSRKIAEIARMISNAAEEFERGAERAPGQLQPTSWGQMFVQEQPQEEATLEQTLAESLVPSSGAYAEAHPSMFLENENVRATPDLSVPGPPNEKAEQPSLLQSTDNYTLSAQGEQIICRYSGVSSDHSGVAGQATSPSRNLLANVKLDSAGAGDQNQQQDGMPRGSGVAYRENSNASYEATLEKMPKPGNGVQEKGMRDTRSPVGVPILAAPSESARSDNAVNPSAHPYVRIDCTGDHASTFREESLGLD
ncbi:hypothetical protein, conserved [Eimeria brunetti]|uniref:Transmembrane protein n=1 Tax=Eimeria brunetti TaxID=51314 RepID=U6LMJ0_9EIME|nr:hypothetical protein, conserved [Eimeria brunetti]